MRVKNTILFVIACLCGLVASIGVSQYMDQASEASAAVETAQIFVAATDINIGDKLDAHNIKLEEWPKDRVPEGAIKELTDLEERYPRTRLYAGEPVLAAKLMDSRDPGSKSITIPKGYRVVSVKVTVDTAVAGLIQPGDRVDLLLFLRKSSEVPETGTRTILRDVNVFSVDGATERSIDADGQARNVRTVSLLVTPKQAETVMLASELGTMFLSLRRPDDTVEHLSEGATVRSMLGTESESANEKGESRDTPSQQGFATWLTSQMQPPSGSAPVRASIGDEANTWTTRVLSQNSFREYQWNGDLNALPQEVTASATGAHAARPAAAAPRGTAVGPPSGGAAEAPAGQPKAAASLQEEPEAQDD